MNPYVEHMRKLAEVGAALCCYMPGAGNPELWPESTCDCKRLPDLFSVLRQEYIQLGDFTSEMTGCVEVRNAWRAMDTLREQAETGHQFMPYPGDRYPSSCLRCGKTKDNPIHRVEK